MEAASGWYDPPFIISTASWIQPGEIGADMLRFVARAGEQMFEESLSRRYQSSEIG